jgi:uncharacterized protein DUF2786
VSEINESLLEKVRALLAKAEATEHPAEAEAFTAKATELMAKYGIQQAMLNDVRPGHDEVGNRIVDTPNPYGIDKAILLQCIASALGCRAIRLRGNDVRVHMFGYGSDLERIEMLYTSLLVQSANALAATPVPRGVPGVSFRKSFLAGFTVAVKDRLEEAERRAQRDAQASAPQGSEVRSVALVLADRSAVVERAYAQAYPSVCSLTTSRSAISPG